VTGRRLEPLRLTALAVGIVVMLLVVLLVTRNPREDGVSTSPVVGKQAPALNGRALIGTSVDVGANDRWLVVNFFATWCVPCVEEHPELKRFAGDHATDGRARVVSVVYGDKASRVKSFFKKNGGTWTVLDANNGRTSLDWGVAKVPESFVVSPTGIVVQRFAGGVTQQLLDDVINQYERIPRTGAESN